MTLSTHSVVGASLAIVARANPVTAFAIGFLSHFILDAIPHWDYKIISKGIKNDVFTARISFGKDVLRDLMVIGFDALLGLFLAYFALLHHPIFGSSIVSSALWGAVGGMFPDFLQFVHFKLQREPLATLQRFHVDFMHAKINLDDKKFIGPAIQVIIILMVIVLIRYFVS